MTDDPEGRNPITPPSNDQPADKVRAVIEAGVEAVPLVGGSLNRLAEEFLPTQAAKARTAWEGAISDRTNEHTTRLDRHDDLLSPKTTLTGLPAELAVALAREPGDGMRGPGRDLDHLCQLLPEADRAALQDAAFELKALNLVQIDRALGPHWWLRLEPSFYEQIDRQVMGWSTVEDACTLAELLLADDARQRTAVLHEASGWEKRRFNPAFRFLLRFIDDRRISREIQANYPSSSVCLLPEDRAALRAFVRRGAA